MRYEEKEEFFSKSNGKNVSVLSLSPARRLRRGRCIDVAVRPSAVGGRLPRRKRRAAAQETASLFRTPFFALLKILSEFFTFLFFSLNIRLFEMRLTPAVCCELSAAHSFAQVERINASNRGIEEVR